MAAPTATLNTGAKMPLVRRGRGRWRRAAEKNVSLKEADSFSFSDPFFFYKERGKRGEGEEGLLMVDFF